MWGKTWDEAIGKNCLELGYPDWHAALHDREIEQVIATRAPVRGVVPFTGTNGTRIYDYIFVPVIGKQGEVEAIAGTTRDITEITQNEERLRESEARFRALVTATSDVIYRMNADWSQMLQLEGRQFIENTDSPSQSWIEKYIPADEQPYLKSAIEKALRDKTVFELEHRVRKLDGTQGWIFSRAIPVLSPQGEIVSWFGIASDVTTRKTAEEARRRLAAIVESSDDAIISKDLNGNVTSWNRQAERLFGYTEQEMVGRSILTIIPPELQSDEDMILSRIRSGQRIEHFETVRVGKSGERVDVSLSISPVRDEHGRVVGAAKIARNITESKKIQQALRTTEKLAAAGRLAATVAHEINNPLESVTNLVYLAKHAAALPDVRHYLSVAEEELNRVSELTKQTLGFYRDTKKIETVSFAPAIASVIGVFSRKAQQNQILIQSEVNDDVKAPAVAGEIRQLIANLLSNSIDAIGSGGRIRIRASRARHWSNDSLPGVRLTVADSGPGIPCDIRGRLFDPFFTTKKDVGTGLGLWVSKSIVERHHGSIRVRTSIRPGRTGTTFSVFLPDHPPLFSDPT